MATGMIQMVFSGEAGIVSALHEHVQAQMPRTAHGAVKYQTKLKENMDGVTARLSVEVPPEFFDELFGQGWRPDAGQQTGSMAGHNVGSLVDRYSIDYRGSR